MIQCIKVHVIAGEKMNTYRIAVCDDDSVMREQLHSFCRELLDGESIPYAITAFPSAAELEKRMNSDVEKPFNLLILDIQMNGMTGLELARSLRSKDDRISIIFVTACDNYLSEGADKVERRRRGNGYGRRGTKPEAETADMSEAAETYEAPAEAEAAGEAAAESEE